MVQIKNILSWLDTHAPFKYAESWDQCGLQVGDPEAVVERILVALDPSSESIKEAEELDCQCLVSHHPLIFRPVTAVRFDQFPGNLIARALLKGIHLIAAHTNLDSAREGTNGQLSRLLNLGALEPLEVEAAWRDESCYGGMGRLGLLPHPISLANLVKDMRGALGDIPIRVVGNAEKKVHRVAVCTGSGGSLIERVIRSGADVYVTGDLKYHEAQRATEANLALMDIGHFASERLVVQPLADYLCARAVEEKHRLEVFASRSERDPFWIA